VQGFRNLPPRRGGNTLDVLRTPVLTFSVLGPVAVRLDGRPQSLPRGRPRAVLAALLVGPARVSAERLAEALWDDPPSSAGPNLRTYVARLRRALGPHADRLTRSGDGYALRVEPGELDRHNWERALAGAQPADDDTTADRLASTLALWTGAAAEGVVRRGSTGRTLDMLDETRLATTELYARACLGSGRLDQAVSCLRPLLADHPAREVAWQHLIRALTRIGDRTGALGAYRTARRALVTEFGIEPGPELRDLQAGLLRNTPEE
jgi:DNA-binding SARP family transcriptional activator